MRVLHIVATDQRRGAEIFASDLVRAIEGDASQEVAILRRTAETAISYNVPTTVLGSEHRVVPGVRVDVAKVRAIRRLISSSTPDVIQVHGGEALKHTVLAQRTLPIVYRRIGSAPPRVRAGLPRIGHGALIRRTARVIAVSEETRRETIETFRLAAEQVITIPGGVDHERLKSRQGREATRTALGIPPASSVILSLGALSWEKDPLAHMRVAAPVLNALPSAVHVFAGDGPLRRSLESTVRALGLAGRVLVLGSRTDVGELLAATDVLLLASRTEGMPSCLIEAGMAGVPAVAYGVGGVREVVEDGVTGIVVRRGDEDGLRRSIVRLLRDDALRRGMGNAAVQRCYEFDIGRVAPRYLQIYRAVIERALEASLR